MDRMWDRGDDRRIRRGWRSAVAADRHQLAARGRHTAHAVVDRCRGVAPQPYDIDRLISRTVAYAAVTALLVAIYVVLAVVVPMVVDVRGDLAVAASTLVVAALFNPLRLRVQRLVDRRFNRAHYDATRTVEEFAERLRSQFDAGALIDDLEAVVRVTMQPTAVSLWMHTRTASDASAQDSSVATGRAQRVAQL
jgi:hypothetical protein